MLYSILVFPWLWYWSIQYKEDLLQGMYFNLIIWLTAAWLSFANNTTRASGVVYWCLFAGIGRNAGSTLLYSWCALLSLWWMVEIAFDKDPLDSNICISVLFHSFVVSTVCSSFLLLLRSYITLTKPIGAISFLVSFKMSVTFKMAGKITFVIFLDMPFHFLCEAFSSPNMATCNFSSYVIFCKRCYAL